MKHTFIPIALTAALCAGTFTHAETQPQTFDSQNAVLDTGILLAIGAQEAEQSLRGAFGWQTFQEGLVEGVYFRFDPDGYARFAPSPRLDTDVFEVRCVARTIVCSAYKGPMVVGLTQAGHVQIGVEGVTPGDQFFVSDGVTELQVPERVLQPLDVRLEALLMTGGDFVVRRSGAPLQTVSLTGFSAVVAYIRWVAAGQDYAVLPRGWPVPNGIATLTRGNITEPNAWDSPSSASQAILAQRGDFQQQRTTVQPTQPVQFEAATTGLWGADTTPVATEQPPTIGELEAQLAAIQQAIEAQRIQPDPAALMTPDTGLGFTSDPQVLDMLRDIHARLISLEHKLEMMSLASVAVTDPRRVDIATSPVADEQDMAESTADLFAQFGNFGADEMEADPSSTTTAGAEPTLESEILRVLQDLALGPYDVATPTQSEQDQADFAPEQPENSQILLERSIVEKILRELDQAALYGTASEAESPDHDSMVAQGSEPAADGTLADDAASQAEDEYKTLSEYFVDAIGADAE